MTGEGPRVGVIAVNFGEPAEADPSDVIAFLERIFLANADLESPVTDEARRFRSRQLAERRAPGLIKEYARIGQSPMNEQALQQTVSLSDELHRRGRDARVYSAFQFTPPLIDDVVSRMRAEGIELVVALPVYPLCGPSTNVAAIDAVHAAIDVLEWGVELYGITGWHRHPLYLQMRVDAIRKLADGNGLDLSDRETSVVFLGSWDAQEVPRPGKPIRRVCRGILPPDGPALVTPEIRDRIPESFEPWDRMDPPERRGRGPIYSR